GSDVSCGGICVDTLTNVANCNGCGNACAVGGVCQSGSCGCPGSETECGGKCVDTASDDQNWGGCGTVCSAAAPSTAQCKAGRCMVTVPLASSGLSTPYGITVDAANVYFTDVNAGSVSKVPIGGGAPTTLVQAPGRAPMSIAVDSTRVYWTEVFQTSLKALP